MAIIKCPHCDNLISTFSNKCPHCGNEYKICSKCGSVSKAQQSFCSNCGYPLSDATATQSNTNSVTNTPNPIPTTNAVQPTTTIQVKGKKFATAAFVLAMVAIGCIIAALSNQLTLQITQDMLHDMSTSTTYYYVANAKEIELLVTGFLVLSVIAAIVSDVMVIFGYVGHAKNIKNGVKVKKVLVFSIIATVAANLSAIIAINLLS